MAEITQHNFEIFSPETGVIGGAVMFLDMSAENNQTRGFYALIGDTEWEDDLPMLDLMISQSDPIAYAVPVPDLPAGLPPVEDIA
jgi:hypothetical protein